MAQSISIRAAALFLHQGHVLLHHTAEDGLWALPGGRVEFGETGEAALRREMAEELSASVDVGALQWVVENQFMYDGRTYAGLEEFTGTPGVTLHMTFHWIPIADLDQVPALKPQFLYQALRTVPGALKHVVSTGS